MADWIAYVIYRQDGDCFWYNDNSWVSDPARARLMPSLPIAVSVICEFWEKFNYMERNDKSLVLLEVIDGGVNYISPLWVGSQPIRKMRELLNLQDDWTLEWTLNDRKLHKARRFMGYE